MQSRQRISIGLERVLYLAATQRTFRNVLGCDRKEALRSWGIDLTPSEQALLDSIPDDTLQTMIDAVRPADTKRRRFMQAVAAASAASVGVVEIACDTPAATGVRPDYDADVDAEVPTDGGTDAVPTGDASP